LGIKHSSLAILGVLGIFCRLLGLNIRNQFCRSGICSGDDIEQNQSFSMHDTTEKLFLVLASLVSIETRKTPECLQGSTISAGL